jgi:hypothetical protein
MTHVTCSVLKTIKKKVTKTEKSRSHIAPSYTSNKKIQTIFNSYTGRTFIFYDNFIITYIELNECTRTMKPKQGGIINELFPGVQSDVNDVFRYRNGILYFLKKKDNKAIS